LEVPYLLIQDSSKIPEGGKSGTKLKKAEGITKAEGSTEKLTEVRYIRNDQKQRSQTHLILLGSGNLIFLLSFYTNFTYELGSFLFNID